MARITVPHGVDGAPLTQAGGREVEPEQTKLNDMLEA